MVQIVLYVYLKPPNSNLNKNLKKLHLGPFKTIMKRTMVTAGQNRIYMGGNYQQVCVHYTTPVYNLTAK